MKQRDKDANGFQRGPGGGKRGRGIEPPRCKRLGRRIKTVKKPFQLVAKTMGEAHGVERLRKVQVSMMPTRRRIEISHFTSSSPLLHLFFSLYGSHKRSGSHVHGWSYSMCIVILSARSSLQTLPGNTKY